MTSTPPDLTLIDGSGGAAMIGRAMARQQIGEFIVPYAYQIWGDGVYHIEAVSDDVLQPDLTKTPTTQQRQGLRIIAHAPLWIRQFGRTLDTSEQLVQLAFRDALSGAIQVEWVNRLQLASKQALVKLSRIGVPVNDANVGALMLYLDHALHLNGPKLQCVLVASRSGAYTLDYNITSPAGEVETRRGHGFLVGERWIGPNGTGVVADPRNLHSNARGFAVHGDEKQWMDKMREVCQFGPIARWLTYSSFAAPLLRYVKQRTFIVHHWGDSGGGKSALAKFAMSAHGDHNALLQSFNRTQISFVEMFKYIDDLPVTFDELQASNMKDHAPIIYAITLEKGRARANREGGLAEEVVSWHSVVRMTGEEPIIGKGGMVDLGGQANRVVQIGTPVLTDEQASSLHQWIDQRHFGWGGLRFLQGLTRVLEFADGEQVLVDRFRDFHRAITERTTIGAHARVSQFACVALAQYLCSRWFDGVEAPVAFDRALEDAIFVSESVASEEIRESVAEMALQLFKDHHAAKRATWYDLSIPDQSKVVYDGTYRQLVGILTQTEVWIVQREGNMILRQAQLPERKVWTAFKRMGILHTQTTLRSGAQAPKAFGVTRSFGQFKAKVYVLDRNRCGPFSSADKDPEDIAAAPVDVTK